LESLRKKQTTAPLGPGYKPYLNDGTDTTLKQLQKQATSLVQEATAGDCTLNMSDSDYQGKLVSTNNVVFNALPQVQVRDGNKTKADGAPTMITAASVVKV